MLRKDTEVRPSSNSEICKRLFEREVVCREHSRLRGRHRSPHHGASQDSPSNVCLARSERARGATVLTEWTSLRPGRDASSRQWRSRARELGVRCLLVEQFTGTEHRVHDDGELAGNGNGRSFEADLFAQFHAPAAQIAVSLAACRDHHRAFI